MPTWNDYRIHMPYTLDTWTTTNTTNSSTYSEIVTNADLKEFAERLAQKIYKIITEHVALDISEEEFIQIIQDE